MARPAGEYIERSGIHELISTLLLQQQNSFKVLTKEDMLKIFPWKLTKLNQLLKANVLPVTKIGNDYLTTEKQIQQWLELYEGKEIIYDD